MYNRSAGLEEVQVVAFRAGPYIKAYKTVVGIQRSVNEGG